MSSSPFVLEWIRRIAKPGAAALDVAMGRGRHALPLARAGMRVFGVDIQYDALHEAIVEARRERLPIHPWCADLTQHPLPRERFDLVVVTRYLQRDLFPAIRDAVVPGGAVIYETFTTDQLALGVGPRSPDHLLKPGELRRAFEGFDLIFYEEVREPEALARIVARKNRAAQ